MIDDETRIVHPTAAMSWKAFTVRIIEALRWPAAFIAVAVIFRGPLEALLTKLTS